MKNRNQKMNPTALLVPVITGCCGLLAAFMLAGGFLPNAAAAAAGPTVATTHTTTVSNTGAGADTCDDSTDPSTCEGIQTINFILNLLAALVLPVIVGVIIFGGIQYSASGGNSEASKEALKRIFTAVVALVAFIGLWGFLQWLIPGGLV